MTDNETMEGLQKEIDRLKDKNRGLDTRLYVIKGTVERLEKENERLFGKEQSARQSLERVTEILTRELGRNRCQEKRY